MCDDFATKCDSKSLKLHIMDRFEGIKCEKVLYMPGIRFLLTRLKAELDEAISRSQGTLVQTLCPIDLQKHVLLLMTMIQIYKIVNALIVTPPLPYIYHTTTAISVRCGNKSIDINERHYISTKF